MILSFCFM